MKKLIMSIAACMLLAPGLAAAKDATFSGEIMDSACARGGGHESMFKKMGTNDPKVCTEACIKGGSKYVQGRQDVLPTRRPEEARAIRRAESRRYGNLE
jgi:hypothetical protein